MTPEQVGARFGLPVVRVQAVADYLKSQGMSIHLVSKNRLAIMADATVAQAQAAFHTQLQLFKVRSQDKQDTGDRFSFLIPPSLPANLAQDVLCISGMENFSRPQKKYLTPTQLQVPIVLHQSITMDIKVKGEQLVFLASMVLEKLRQPIVLVHLAYRPRRLERAPIYQLFRFQVVLEIPILKQAKETLIFNAVSGPLLSQIS